MEQPNINLDYSSYLNSTNDLSKISKVDVNKTLNIDVDVLKQECINYNTKETVNQRRIESFDLYSVV